MTEAITPSTDVNRLARRLYHQDSPAELRRANHRRQELERYAVTMADGNDLRLDLDSKEGNPARVTLRGNLPHIHIPAWEMPQPVTDFNRKPYDYLMQKTMTIHELGHVLYTDQDAVDEALDQVEPGNHEFFHKIWNALEDGAIEEELRREFNVAGDLAVANANFGAAGASGVTEYGMADAIITGCLDLAVYNSGRLEALLDPNDTSAKFESDDNRLTFVSDVLPEIRDAAVDVVGESDPEARTERILELWERLTEILDLEEMSDSQVDQGGKGNHAEQDNGSGNVAENLEDLDSDELRDFVDDIAGNGSGITDSDDKNGADRDESNTGTDNQSGDSDGQDSDERSEDATTGQQTDREHDGGATEADDSKQKNDDQRSSETSPERGSTSTPQTGSSSDSTEDDGPSDESGGNDRGNDSKDRSDAAPRRKPEDERGLIEQDSKSNHQDVVDDYERQVKTQETDSTEAVQDFQDEFEELRQTLERIEADGDEPTELQVTSPAEARTDAWMDARRTGNRLKRILHQQLQEEERGRMRRGLRSGKIDSRSLTRLKQRDLRVFRKREDPEGKDYAVILILDRSGSMRRDIHDTEEACASLAYALHSLDIDTSVLDVCDRTPKLAKPFGVDPKNCLETLLTGETSGSTPLSPALRIARERLEEREEFPFVVILTDGRPDNPREYMTELKQCRFPVLGVYINFGGSSDPANVNQSAEYFDERRIVTDRNQLPDELRKLCQSVMF